MRPKNDDNFIVWAMAFLHAMLVCAILIIGYIAVFKHQDCITRQECHEIVDSILIQIYD